MWYSAVFHAMPIAMVGEFRNLSRLQITVVQGSTKLERIEKYSVYPDPLLYLDSYTLSVVEWIAARPPAEVPVLQATNGR